MKAVYHNRLGLRQEMFPDRFVGREVKQAKPTLRADIGEQSAQRSRGVDLNSRQSITRILKSMVTSRIRKRHF